MRLIRTAPMVASAFLVACTAGGAAPQSGAATEPAAPSVEIATPSAPISVAAVLASSGVPFSLYVHCGISTTTYAGRDWVVAGPVPALTARADASESSVTDNSLDGVMTEVGEDRLRFVVSDSQVEESGASIEFVPTAPPTSHCE